MNDLAGGCCWDEADEDPVDSAGEAGADETGDAEGFWILNERVGGGWDMVG